MFRAIVKQGSAVSMMRPAPMVSLRAMGTTSSSASGSSESSFASGNNNYGVKQHGNQSASEGRPAWPVNNRSSFFSQNEAMTKKVKSMAPKETSRQALTKILDDLKELRLQNPDFSIQERGTDQIVLKLANRPEVPLFKVTILGDEELGFETASSAGMMRTYKRNEFNEWNCSKDGHNLHGLFVRDLLPYINGLPGFAIR